MHFMLSWTHPGDDAALRACIADVPHQEAFPGCMVVRVPGFAVYESISERLSAFDAPGFHFLMSPISQTGQYYGKLPEDVARAVDELSTP